MVTITEAIFESLNNVDISATTEPSTTTFLVWITWAEDKMKTYLQCGDTLPTDIGGILKNVANDLLARRWDYVKAKKRVAPSELLSDQVRSPPLELSVENKRDLDLLKGQSSGGEPVAFNFDLDTTTGGFN